MNGNVTTTTPSSVSSSSSSSRTNKTIVLVAGGGEFNDPIQRGFLDTCAEWRRRRRRDDDDDVVVDCFVRIHSVPCVPDETTWLRRLRDVVSEFVTLDDDGDEGRRLDGLAINSRCRSEAFFAYLRRLVRRHGTTLVTYGRDLPLTTTTLQSEDRYAFVGTDDAFMGRTVARLLRRLEPGGGTYAAVGYKRGRTEAFVRELERYNDPRRGSPRRRYAPWHAVMPPRDTPNDGLYEEMVDLLERRHPPLTALVTLRQTPMRHVNFTSLLTTHPNVTVVGVDAADYQIGYLERRLVRGLVGQLPYEMGVTVARASVRDPTLPIPQSPSRHVKTNLVAYNVIPLELPPLTVDRNELGSLRWMGFIFWMVTAIAAGAGIVWTHRHRHQMVVRAAQPGFLVMIAVGVILLTGSLVPLSFDDGGYGSVRHHGGRGHGDADDDDQDDITSDHDDDGDYGNHDHPPFWDRFVCMSVPWLACTGFCVIFSALMAKTWRVNQVYRRQTYQHRRQQQRQTNTITTMTTNGNNNNNNLRIASVTEVLKPFAVLLTCKWALLLAWTLTDPLEYTRLEHEGTDYWNRVLSTYGVCRSQNGNTLLAFLIPLAALNFASVVLGCWQAFQARHVASEFSEATYIGLTVATLGQAFLTGIPVVVVVRDNPRAYYVVLCLTVFLLGMAVLGFIFGPKYLMQQNYAGKTPAEQARMIREGLRNHHNNRGNSSGSGGTQRRRTPSPSPSPPGKETDDASSAVYSPHRYDSSSMDDSDAHGYRSAYVRSENPSSTASDDNSNYGTRENSTRDNELTLTNILESQPDIIEEEEEEEDEEEECERSQEVPAKSSGHETSTAVEPAVNPSSSSSPSTSSMETARQIQDLLGQIMENDQVDATRLREVQRLVASLVPEK